MQNKLIIGALAVAVLIVGGAMYLQKSPSTPGNQSAAVLNAVQPNPATGSVKEFSITSRQFSFDPSVIRVKKGDTVRIKTTSIDVTHGIAIPAFNFNVQSPVGSWQTGEFVADKTGTIDFYCSVFCGSGHRDMKGQLIVE